MDGLYGDFERVKVTMNSNAPIPKVPRILVGFSTGEV